MKKITKTLSLAAIASIFGLSVVASPFAMALQDTSGADIAGTSHIVCSGTEVIVDTTNLEFTDFTNEVIAAVNGSQINGSNCGSATTIVLSGDDADFLLVDGEYKINTLISMITTQDPAIVAAVVSGINTQIGGNTIELHLRFNKNFTSLQTQEANRLVALLNAGISASGLDFNLTIEPFVAPAPTPTPQPAPQTPQQTPATETETTTLKPAHTAVF